jgi:hypothetical protein
MSREINKDKIVNSTLPQQEEPAKWGKPVSLGTVGDLECCPSCGSFYRGAFHAKQTDCEDNWHADSTPLLGQDETANPYKMLGDMLHEAGAIPVIDGVRIEPKGYRYKTSEEAALLPLPLQLLRLQEINAQLCHNHNTLLVSGAQQERQLTQALTSLAAAQKELQSLRDKESAEDAWNRAWSSAYYSVKRGEIYLKPYIPPTKLEQENINTNESPDNKDE